MTESAHQIVRKTKGEVKHLLGLLSLALSLVLAGCVWPGNWPHHDDVATYKPVGDRYVIEVYGRALAYSDEIINIVSPKTYRTSQQYDVPRIEGKIDGNEIRQKPGYYKYVGSITIHDKEMVIDLSTNNYDEHRLDRDHWSGSYTLVEKKEDEKKAVPALK